MDKFKKIFLFLLELEEQTHVHLKIKKFQKLTFLAPPLQKTFRGPCHFGRITHRPTGHIHFPYAEKANKHFIYNKNKFLYFSCSLFTDQ